MMQNLLNYSTKAEVLSNVLLSGIGAGLPSCREAAIQVDKLRRLVAEIEGRFPSPWVFATASKNLRKKQVAHIHRLTQQSDRVDTVITGLYREHVINDFYHERPTLTDRRRVTAEAQEFVRNFNNKVHQACRQALLTARPTA